MSQRNATPLPPIQSTRRISSRFASPLSPYTTFSLPCDARLLALKQSDATATAAVASAAAFAGHTKRAIDRSGRLQQQISPFSAPCIAQLASLPLLPSLSKIAQCSHCEPILAASEFEQTQRHARACICSDRSRAPAGSRSRSDSKLSLSRAGKARDRDRTSTQGI